MSVLHQSYIKEHPFGGTATGTLCDRDHATDAGGYLNIADGGKKVTCKFCLKMLDSREGKAKMERMKKFLTHA